MGTRKNCPLKMAIRADLRIAENNSDRLTRCGTPECGAGIASPCEDAFVEAAWDAIDAMNNLSGVSLVKRLTIGKGATRLTARGESSADLYRQLDTVKQP